MIDALTNSASSTATEATAGLTGAAQKMGKNEFLKLLVAQLQNQDPLKPQDNSAFVAELAQFSNLEQTIGINERLDALQVQSQGLQNSNIVNMVGAKATVRGSMITANGSGDPVGVRFGLEGNSATTTITITDLDGKKIRTIDVGARRTGTISINWDGRSDAGLVQPKGTYKVAVSAKNEAGSTIATSQETTGTVKAVSFDKGYPVLQLDNGVAVPVADLIKVEH